MLFGRRTQKWLARESHWRPFTEKCFHLGNLSALLKKTQGTLRFWRKRRAQFLVNSHRTIFKYVPNWSITYYTCVLLLNEKNEFIQLYKEKTKDRHYCLQLPHGKPISQSLLRGAVTGWVSVGTSPKWKFTVMNTRKKICCKNS